MQLRTSRELVIAVEDVTVKKSVFEFATKKQAERKCLKCDRESYSLGLCSKHYQETNNVLKVLPPVERLQERARLMEEGNLWDKQLARSFKPPRKRNPLIDQEAAK